MKIKFMFLIVLSLVLLSACVPGSDMFVGEDNTAGFFMGVWHGWIAPFSLIFGFFNDTSRIYEPNNTGWWYDFGFYMAIISGFGGFSLSRKNKNKY